ncbi:transmembrane protein 138 [Agrilus planipennis]|uniref:Transmembrane protein 138 n=1 Tax=Agrilus planipennis TaxID=224129 RepID=A0A1W4X1S6_AGRPL|nr:transmembrane protein 138 [Agrilus planipennis]
MKLTVRRYGTILAIQTLLLIVDLSINTFSILIRKHNALMLIMFIIQDVCLILALAALLLTFFSTYVFQAGLVEMLYDRFRLSIIICMFYFILTTILHIWTLSVRWKDPTKHNWSSGLYVMYILQRLMSPYYYYYYKRASLRISDPGFYEDVQWVQGLHNSQIVQNTSI